MPTKCNTVVGQTNLQSSVVWIFFVTLCTKTTQIIKIGGSSLIKKNKKMKYNIHVLSIYTILQVYEITALCAHCIYITKFKVGLV